jgi:capsular exopolysaccharide synthesis family protein
MSEHSTKQVDLRTYLKAVWRRKWLFLVPVLAGVVTGFIVAQALTPVYESRSKIVMRVEERLSEPLTRLVGPTVEEDQLSRLQEKVKSTTFLVELVRTLEMAKEPAIVAWAEDMHAKDQSLTVEAYAESKAVEYLQRRIVISRTSAAGFEVIVRDLDPDRACLLAQHITSSVVSSSAREQLDEIRAVHDFSVEQIVIYKQKLDEAESALRRYQSRRVERTPVENPVNAQNVNRVDVLMSQAGVDEARAGERLTERQSALRTAAGADYDRFTAVGAEALRSATDELVGLERQVASALVRQPQGGPEVNSLLVTTAEKKGELRRTARSLASRTVAGASAASLDAFAELKVAEAEVEMVAERKSVLDQFMWGYTRGRATATEDELELARLKQEVESNRALYEAFVEQSAAGQIQEALEAARAGGRFEVIEAATRPIAPVAPNKPMILVLSLLAGVVVGFAIVLATEQSDTSFKDVEEIERALELPVLATVPDAEVFRAVAAREKALRRQGAARPTAGDSPLIQYLVRETPISFEFRRMARKLAKKHHGEIPKAILVTSSNRGEGKTTSAACLAITLAKHYDRKTVLVDCDLRKPRVHLLMEVPSASGISDALERGHLLGLDVKATSLPNLFVLPCGSTRDRATWLLESLPGSRVMSELLARFDHVVLDTAPNVAVPDALLLGAAADAVVMVVKAGVTPKEVVVRGLSLQQEDRANVLGFVVNNLERVLPYYYDYKYYGYATAGSEPDATGGPKADAGVEREGPVDVRDAS